VYEQGLLQKEAAEEMGIAESTISKYLKKYRSGNITE
jgi:predicted transcriptional regulator